MLRDVADSAGEAMTKAAAAHTPKRTGTVAESWRQLPVKRARVVGGSGYESGTENPHWVARFLEYGTEAHLISPKTRRALGLPEGPKGGAHHPGIRPRNMTAKAATEVEATFGELAAPHLSAWQAEIERNAKQHKGIH